MLLPSRNGATPLMRCFRTSISFCRESLKDPCTLKRYCEDALRMPRCYLLYIPLPLRRRHAGTLSLACAYIVFTICSLVWC